MTKEEALCSLAIQTDSKLVMVAIETLDGLPMQGKTELETAKIPQPLNDFPNFSVVPPEAGSCPGSYFVPPVFSRCVRLHFYHVP